MSCLIVQENTCFQLNNFYLVIKSHLGKFADVDYYKVSIQEVNQTNPNVNLNSTTLGLLRIGDINGRLSRELQLRHVLQENEMISELLAFGVEEVYSSSNTEDERYLENSFNYPKLDADLSAQIDFGLSCTNNNNYPAELDSHQIINNYNELSSKKSYFDKDYEDTEDYEYLEDEQTKPTNTSPNPKLLLLSYLPTEGQTLHIWLQKKHSREMSLALTNQVCQLFQQTYQQGWCFFQIIPQFIQVDSTIKFFDLSNVCLVGERVTSSRETDYCAPEIAFDCTVSEGMSTYILGTLLYQSIYQQLPDAKLNSNSLDIQSIPGIYQIISLCLSPVIEERISLTQLLKVLGETKQTFRNCKVQWDVASRSTIGLSRQRLHNEDNYGVQQYSSSYNDMILAVLADGMGGLEQGELASQLAVQAVIETPIDCSTDNDKCNEWLISVVKKANKYVTENINKGGTTLSIAWANSRHLRIAHVGDSRIYLIRKEMLCQLSEDHSLVAMLLADGDITYEESQKHPQRNILTRCVGSKETLKSGHVQTLQSFGSSSSILIEQDDIIILCSDGVWGLVPQTELAEIFTKNRSLKIAVNNTINLVLLRGARDNATIVAMRCSLSNQY